MKETFTIEYPYEVPPLPADVRERAAAVLREGLSKDPETVEMVKALYAEKGPGEWIHSPAPGSSPRMPISLHGFAFGMQVRNYLREHGITDDLVPTKNLDDYYVECIEDALDLKPSGATNP